MGPDETIYQNDPARLKSLNSMLAMSCHFSRSGAYPGGGGVGGPLGSLKGHQKRRKLKGKKRRKKRKKGKGERKGGQKREKIDREVNQHDERGATQM